MHAPHEPDQHVTLPRQVTDLYVQVVVEQLRQKCLQEGKGEVGARGYSALTQSSAEWLLEPGKPCGGERLLLMFDRWRKLLKVELPASERTWGGCACAGLRCGL